MSVEQTLLIFNAPARLLFEKPDKYFIRNVGRNERAWQVENSEHTRLAIIYCESGEDVVLAKDLRFTKPYLPIIIASSDNLFRVIARESMCGSMSINANTAEFLAAEQEAYRLAESLMKKTG